MIIRSLSRVYTGEVRRDVARGIAPSLPASATLGGMAEEIGLFLLFVMSPKVAKAST
jgi:hypothetical protein